MRILEPLSCKYAPNLPSQSVVAHRSAETPLSGHKLYPFSRGAESVGRSRRTVTQNSKKSVQGPKSSPRSTATCAKPSLKEGSGKGGQGSPHSLPILKNSSPVETDKSTQPTGKKLTTAEGWMDPCAVPDEESGEGTVVTIYPSLPQSSFLGSGEQTLVAQTTWRGSRVSGFEVRLQHFVHANHSHEHSYPKAFA